MTHRSWLRFLWIARVAMATAAFAFMASTTMPLAASDPEVASVVVSKTNQNRSADLSKELALDECLSMAMENNHRRPASRFAVAVAEAQHRQALAAYWPQVNLKGLYHHRDEAPNFLFPTTSIPVPGGTAVITVPPGVLGPRAVQLPVSIPSQTIDTPEQDIRLADPDSFLMSLNASWLLYDGGMRKGLREQTQGWLDVVKQDARRTDLEIVDSVKRFYFGAILARQLHRVGQDTLARMEATLSLTEMMYKEGSGRVKKTDYLDNKVMVETLRSTVALLEKNREMAQAALANAMGLSWKTKVNPLDREVPFAPYAGNLEDIVGTAYRFSPDWVKVEAAIRAAEGAIKTARSGHFPKLAVTGDLHKWWNDYDAGMATDQNKEGWSVGVGIEIPIFSGFLTRNKVTAARSRLSKITQEQFLLKEGIGLQIKDIFLGLDAARKSHQATLDAMLAAQDNRDLHTRAYQNELVETDKVIRAQLIEALMSAQHYKTRYDHVALKSRLNLVVGTEVLKKLQTK